MTVLAKARLSAKCRIGVPHAIRERLDLRPGDAFAFEERNGAIVIRAAHDSLEADPFAAFHEWAGREDDEAYADL